MGNDNTDVCTTADPSTPALEGLVWHASDAAVKPIVANRRIERLPEPKFEPKALPFPAMSLQVCVFVCTFLSVYTCECVCQSPSLSQKHCRFLPCRCRCVFVCVCHCMCVVCVCLHTSSDTMVHTHSFSCLTRTITTRFAEQK